MSSESDPLLPGRRAPSTATGGWKSALFIIWVEVAERFAYYGISSNLISYLTGPLGQTTAAAAASVNAWSGAASMLPLLGAAVADSWLGRYRTIVASSVLYIAEPNGPLESRSNQALHTTLCLVSARNVHCTCTSPNLVNRQGLGMLTLSSMLPSPQQCRDSADGQGVCPPSSLQTAFFYISLYLVAIAQSGHKPCVQAFGADQFDATDPGESVSRASFFNWWYFGLCLSATVTVGLMSYVQDNVGWALGFGVPTMVMLLALVIFLLGTRTYRFYSSGSGASTFRRVGKAFVAWRKRSQKAASVELEHGELPQDDAVLVEEVKGMARLFPIWATCLLYGVVFAQPPTLFTKQAATLDRRVGPSFQIPPAALQCFLGVSIITCVVLYDRVLVPAARRVSGVASGITMLQRIGTGIALALVTLVVAALVEMRRLQAARDAGLVDGSGSEAAVPMSLWWVVPQYVLLGAADVFTMVGMQEFFYDQVPGALKSLGLALYLSVLGVGSFISSFLITVIDVVTRSNGGEKQTVITDPWTEACVCTPVFY
ncbi:hypothetical protein BS78_09G155000 [Paspalum vaginatum]|nr:hypothetical protein BS78_09G155000 [Paspalum vaginatum]